MRLSPGKQIVGRHITSSTSPSKRKPASLFFPHRYEIIYTIMNDRELESEWKPSGRPQSTLARSFSAQLDDLFALSNGAVEDLSVSIFSKQQSVQTQNRELEQLEAKLRETEQRLQQQKDRRKRLSQQLGSSSQPGSPNSSTGRYSPNRRKMEEDMFKEPTREERASYPRSPLSSPTEERYSETSAEDDSPMSQKHKQ